MYERERHLVEPDLNKPGWLALMKGQSDERDLVWIARIGTVVLTLLHLWALLVMVLHV